MIRSKLVENLSLKEYDQCRSLTLSGLSLMRDQLQWDRYRYDPDSKESRAIMVLEDDAKIVAWGLLHSNGYEDERILYIYVHKDHRRKKLGSKIYRHACRLERTPPLVCPCNDVNRKFFNSLKASAARGWNF